MSEPVELEGDGQRATVDAVGGGLRSYAAHGRELLDGYAAGEPSPSGRGQVLIPWPNRLEDGSYEFDGRRHQLPLNEPETGTRSTASSAGPSGRSRSASRLESRWRTCSSRSRAIRSASSWRSSTRSR